MFFNDENRHKIRNLIPFVEKQKLPKLLSWEDFELIINNRVLVGSGRVCPVSSTPPLQVFSSCWSMVSDSWPAGLLDQLVVRKQTFFVRDLSKVNNKVNSMCSEIEYVTKAPCDLHAFCSLLPFHEGLSRHHDINHNIIAPQEGVINVTVYDEDKEIIKEDLQCGDFVFIPAGVDHKVESNTARLSCSFPIPSEGDFNFTEFEDRHWIVLPKGGANESR